MKLTHNLGLLFALACATGCAAALPPAELVSARTAYNRANTGPATQLNPADLHTAKESLDIAEQSFEKDGDSQETKDLAYAAERRAQVAESRARAAAAVAQKEGTLAKMNAGNAALAQSSTAQLGRANQQIATQDQTIQGERARREEAEKRAAKAAADLAKLASVKQEPRGMVITLSGAVLFASAKWDLLPSAQVKLNDVADALTKQDPDSKMIVEGHTDSQGAASFNQDLSQKRAQAVRDYLVSRGISADRVTAQGFGPSRSIADNNSAEGRANNRRVEIVVTPSTPKAN